MEFLGSGLRAVVLVSFHPGSEGLRDWGKGSSRVGQGADQAHTHTHKERNGS